MDEFVLFFFEPTSSSLRPINCEGVVIKGTDQSKV